MSTKHDWDWEAIRRHYGPVLAALFAEMPERSRDWTDKQWHDWFTRVLRAAGVEVKDEQATRPS